MQDQTAIDTIEIPIFYIEVFTLMFVSFLIGYLFAFYYQKSKYNSDKFTSDLDDQITLETNLDKSDYSKDVASKSQKYSINVQDEITFSKEKGYLDFERLGYANEDIKDDLQRIAGIGPFTEEKLNNIGIYTFDQIKSLNKTDIRIITELIRFFPDRIQNDKWTEQAEIFSNQKLKSKQSGTVKI
ncbi:MAG: hypothetical protein WA951_03165 [Leeuwenhoekiella sp.]